MSQEYTDKRREADPNALPDVEVFFVSNKELDGTVFSEAGWYYWACFPGCLPDGDPMGPFDTEDAAISDMRESWGNEE